MRKLLSILLLATLGLPFAAPLLALAGTSEAGLAACCRRSGKHRCSMVASERHAVATDKTVLAAPLEKCPYAPQATLFSRHDLAALPFSASTFSALLSDRSCPAQTESKWRIARDRSRQKRGPPSLRFAYQL